MQFHLEQAKMRTLQRLQEGRAKPIDVLAKNLHLAEGYEVDSEAPYQLFGGLTLHEIRELVTDIKEYQASACRCCRFLCMAVAP